MITTSHDQYFFGTVRYNNNTYKELSEYKNQKKFTGCIYNVPREMPNSITKEAKVFMFEMNNDTNQIEGVGYLLNKIRYDKYYKIHSDSNYNQCSYIGKYHITRDNIISNREYKDIIELIEGIVFRGKDHIKRGQGVISIPSKKIKEHKVIIFNSLKKMFMEHFDNILF